MQGHVFKVALSPSMKIRTVIGYDYGRLTKIENQQQNKYPIHPPKQKSRKERLHTFWKLIRYNLNKTEGWTRTVVIGLAGASNFIYLLFKHNLLFRHNFPAFFLLVADTDGLD